MNVISSPYRSWYDARSRRASLYSCRLSAKASQLIAQVIRPFGQPRANASLRERMWAGLLSGVSSSPIERVGVTSIWLTRTTETWVMNRPRRAGAAGADAIALCAGKGNAPENAALAALVRNCRLLYAAFVAI